MRKFLYETDILLPDNVDMTKWSVIACDQYTSNPAYWENLNREIGDAPSTLRMILPEIYLNESESRIGKINATMAEYQKHTLSVLKDAMIYIERTLPSGKCRRGIVGAVDLCDYDFSKGSVSAIRATEGTVMERIPPRVAIRRNAPLEFPHIMLFVNDEKKQMIESFSAPAASGKMEKLYDFKLCAGGGSIRGFLISKVDREKIHSYLDCLAVGENPLVFAVGDGNHSLATAKTCFEELRREIGDEAAMRHPARYALCEVVNIHDDSIVFEPIYRVAFNVNASELFSDFAALSGATVSDLPSKTGTEFEVLFDGSSRWIRFENPNGKLPVLILQEFLDEYQKSHPQISVDYIHGENSVRELTTKENTIGFLFSGIDKSVLFDSIVKNGSLPRKAFSMGSADEKRFYLEGRAIREA